MNLRILAASAVLVAGTGCGSKTVTVPPPADQATAEARHEQWKKARAAVGETITPVAPPGPGPTP